MIRYVSSAVAVLGAKGAVYASAPFIAAWGVKFYPEDKYPVATLLGKDRPHLVPWLRWAQTFDDALDSYWYWESKSAWLRRWFDQDYYDNHKWLQWFTRVLWLWRNPAYGLAYKLGFDQTGLQTTFDDDPEDQVWDSKQPCKLTRKFVNGKGEKGFLIRRRSKHFEMVLEYKVPWADYKNAMLAVRFKLRT